MGRAAKNYPRELKDRAMAMVREVRPDYPSEYAAIEAVAAKLAIGTPETLRKWIRQAEIDSGARQGVTSEESAEVRKLRAENRELRRANEILKAASIFFARISTARFGDRQVHRREQGQVRGRADVCPARRLGLRIRPVHLLRRPSPAAVAARYPGRVSMELIQKAYDENYSCYGARKIWLALRQDDHDVARCTVERSMRVLGLRGASGKVKRTTIADPAAARAGDLVGRNFAPPAPNLLWVADFTYISTLAGWVYVAFVSCLCAAHSRMESLVIDDGRLAPQRGPGHIYTETRRSQ